MLFLHSIPSEIFVEILCRLPVKTLIRISLVCKSWYSLIRNPNFINTHVNRSISHAGSNENDGFLLLIPHYFSSSRSEKKCIVLCGGSLDVHETFKFEFLNETMFFRNFGGFCNGLVCLAELTFRIEQKIVLYNPSIRKFKQLPSSSLWDSISQKKKAKTLFCRGTEAPHVIGFGFDEINNDYKVVRVFVGRRFKPAGELYSLRTDSWKRIQVSDCWFGGKSLFVNGAAHWLKRGYDRKANGIMAFDFCNEVFYEISLPDECAAEDIYLMAYNGSLSLLETWYEGLCAGTCYGIWVMKEYGDSMSWTKQFTGLLQGSFFHARGCTKNGKLIFLRNNGSLAVLDPNNSKLVDSGIKNPDNIVDDYRESLIFIEDGNRFLDIA